MGIRWNMDGFTARRLASDASRMRTVTFFVFLKNIKYLNLNNIHAVNTRYLAHVPIHIHFRRSTLIKSIFNPNY
jgi:hypothetical protein